MDLKPPEEIEGADHRERYRGCLIEVWPEYMPLPRRGSRPPVVWMYAIHLLPRRTYVDGGGTWTKEDSLQEARDHVDRLADAHGYALPAA